MENKPLLPWFAPMVSPRWVRLIEGLGRKEVLLPGQTFTDGTFSNRLVLVSSGIVTQATLHPSTQMPFMLRFAAKNSFALMHISEDVHLPRRYWATTRCELLSIIPELLLQLIDFEDSLEQEIKNYEIFGAASDRLGMMVCQAGDLSERLLAFILARWACEKLNAESLLARKNVRWIALPKMPSRRIIASVVRARLQRIDELLRTWMDNQTLIMNQGQLYIRRSVLLQSWRWLDPLVEDQYLRMKMFTINRHPEVNLDI